MKIEDCFYLGYITKTKGLKGEVQVFFEYPDPEDLTLDNVFIDIAGKLIPFFVNQYKLYPNQTGLFFFEDIDVIEKAEKIIRKKIYLPNSQKPERDPELFEFSDLKGFIAFDKTFGELGEIIEVNEYPQQVVATVHYKFRDVLFPINDDFIIEIDDEKNELHLDLPEGLLDVYLNE